MQPIVPHCTLSLSWSTQGDQPATAEAIGRQVNLITGPTLGVWLMALLLCIQSLRHANRCFADDVAAERGVDIADIDPLTDPDVRSIVLAGTALVDLPEAT